MKKRISIQGRVLRSGGGDRSLRCVLSTGGVARDNHTIDPYGWVLPRSKSVPLVDSHRDHEGIRSVLGKVTDITVGTASLDSGRTAPALMGTLRFAEPEVSPDAEVALQLYRAGYADSVSVSFIPIEWEYSDRGSGMDISKAELLEVSAVAVPSDVNARVLARAVRAQLGGYVTASDRRVLAEEVRRRIQRDDAAAGFFPRRRW